MSGGAAVSGAPGAAAADVEAFFAALELGKTPAEGALALLPPPERRLLRRCALVRRFDRAAVEEVLRPLAGPEARSVSFEYLQRLPGVAPAPGRPGWYRVDARDRADYETSWLEGGPADDPLGEELFRAANERLADWFAARGPDGELEMMFHRIAADAAIAGQVFHAQYADATRRFDLARCESLLEVLDQRARFLDAELASFRTDARGLLRARGAVADDYYRSARYLERGDLRTAFEALLADRTKFVLHLYGGGGRGKTMFLRWLSSRYCFDRQIPVARIDFDFLDVSEIGLEPRFFFGKLAERLNLQLRGAPFVELLDTIAQMRVAAVGRRARRGEQRARATADEEHEVRRRFALGLEESCRGPVLLVFDTVEDARLKHRVDVLQIVRAVDEVRRFVEARSSELSREPPRIVLLLSGRYPLEEQHPEVVEARPGAIQSVPVTPFKPAEARRYLMENRGLAESDLLDVVIARSGGSPFHLALYADVLHTTPAITKAELDRSTSIELRYLMERILRRIPDYRVRWVLRYGVTARRLTRRFLEDVLGPHLARAMRGDKQYDDPAIDAVDGDPNWPEIWRLQERRSRLSRSDFDEVWTLLQRYASASSWVTEVGDVLVIQPAVTHPMRAALREQKVVRRIHRDAVDTLARRVVKKGPGRAEDLSALTYHDFQLRGAKAARAWVKRVAENERDPAAQQALASVVLSEDLQETEAGGASPVPPEIAARAHFMLAWAARTAAEAEDGEQAEALRDQARLEFERYDAIAATLPVRFVSRAAEAVLFWNLAVSPAEKEAALARLADAESRKASPGERDELLATLEDAWLRRDPARAEGYARKRAAAARRKKDAAAYGAAVRSIVAYQVARAAYVVALRECAAGEAALRAPKARWKPLAAAASARRGLEVVRLSIELQAGLGEGELARRFLAAPRANMRERLDELLLCALLRLAAGDPTGAIREARDLRRGSAPVRNRGGRSAGTRQRALYWHMRAMMVEANARRTLLALNDALELLHEAMLLAGDLGMEETEARQRLAMGRVYLFDLGDLRQAEEHVRRRESAPPTGSTEVERMLLDASLEELKSNRAQAAELWQQLERTLSQPTPGFDEQAVLVATHALALRPPEEHGKWLARLGDALKRLDHPLPRLARLRALRYAPVVRDVPPALADEVASLVTPARGDPWFEGLSIGDAVRARLLRAEVLRVLGREEEARRDLRAMRPGLRLARPLLHRHVAQLCDRLAVPADEVLPVDWLESLGRDLKHSPGVVAVSLLEAGERAFRAGEPTLAASLAGESRRLLAKAGFRSKYDVRLMELFSSLGKAAGNPAVAKDYAARANRIRDELGQPRAQEIDLGSEAAPGSASRPARLAELGAVPSSVAFDSVVAQGDGGVEYFTRPTSRIGGWLGPTMNSLVEGLLSGSGSFELIEALVRNAPSFGESLAAGLLSGSMREEVRARGELAPEETIDVVIEFDAPGGHGIPWEMAVLDPSRPNTLVHQPGVRHVVRAFRESAVRTRLVWAQRALAAVLGQRVFADGVLGPATKQVVADFQRQSSLSLTGQLDGPTRLALRDARRAVAPLPSGPRRVVLIESAAEHEQRIARGHQSRGTNLADLYAKHGFTVHAVREPNFDDVRSGIGEDGCTVLHIAAPIGESRSTGELFLRFGSKSVNERTATPFGPGPLGSLLKSASARGPYPFVILDPPSPGHLEEVARQLVLRNVFAAQLVWLGLVPVVLACGLLSPEEQREASTRLVEGISERTSPGELSKLLRGPPPTALTSHAPFRPRDCVALFTVDPGLDPADLYFPEAD